MKKMFGTALILSFFAFGTSMKAYSNPKNVAVIIKATDSEFWQSVLLGAENYAKENPTKVKIKTYGPPSEADIDQQVAILENVISTNPDGIVIASTSSDATVPAIDRAVSEGIPVVTVDNRVNTDKITTHLSTDNLKGGALAADMLVENLKKNGTPLKGDIGLISSMAGVKVLADRDEGFIKRLKEIAPDLKILPVRYADNDILKALGAAEDMLTANPNIVGFFGDNNHMGDGISRALKERQLQDKIVAVAYDTDPEEVASLKEGVLKALIVQDPYGMGYKGVDTVLKAINKEPVEDKYIDTGVTAITPENMEDAKMKALLDPFILKKK